MKINKWMSGQSGPVVFLGVLSLFGFVLTPKGNQNVDANSVETIIEAGWGALSDEREGMIERPSKGSAGDLRELVRLREQLHDDWSNELNGMEREFAERTERYESMARELDRKFAEIVEREPRPRGTNLAFGVSAIAGVGF